MCGEARRKFLRFGCRWRLLQEEDEAPLQERNRRRLGKPRRANAGVVVTCYFSPAALKIFRTTDGRKVFGGFFSDGGGCRRRTLTRRNGFTTWLGVALI
ncbi:hypothetical protein MTP99_016731 [Tenebrio molitor]|nr:hypothetical protein MTP99_016731 [Tenebrio molitor]